MKKAPKKEPKKAPKIQAKQAKILTGIIDKRLQSKVYPFEEKIYEKILKIQDDLERHGKILEKFKGAETPDAKFSKYAEKIRKIIEKHKKDTFALKAEIDRAITSVSSNTKSMERIENIEEDVKSLKSVLENFDVKNLEDQIFMEFGEINKKIKTGVRSNKEFIDRIDTEVKIIKEEIEKMRTARKSIKGMEGMRHEIESLKAKNHWLESQIERIKIKPIVEKIIEIEKLIQGMTVAQPIVIE
jgi:HPt (histidine-containing phosphotransfer) domain-containing protein